MRGTRGLVVILLAVGVFGEATAAPIDLPLKTWVKRLLPAPGVGACPFGCKHMRLTLNPLNGRVYFEGGDYGAEIYYDSGRQETYSYSIADDAWQREFPYCGPAGTYQPQHPDEVGWVFDSRRNLFWMVPGYMGTDSGTCSSSGPAATPVQYEIMTFDPAARTWTWPTRAELPVATLGGNKFAQYDPVEDTIIQFLYNGGYGVGIYHIQTDTWDQRWFGGNGDIAGSWSAMDLQQRVIYVSDGYAGKLLRYDMDAKTLTAIANMPVMNDYTRSGPHLSWDPANRVLYFFDYYVDLDPTLSKFSVYHVDTNTWESLPVVLPEDGGPVFGNHQIYDPAQNAFLVMGGTVDLARPYFYLFRYGNGSGGAPSDSIAPSPPANLRPR